MKIPAQSNDRLRTNEPEVIDWIKNAKPTKTKDDKQSKDGSADEAADDDSTENNQGDEQ